MAKTGLLFVISGPSGVGKGTVLQRLFDQNPGCVPSVSATTRAPRPGEVHGKSYFFLSREQFGDAVARGEMLEYAQYNGNYYGTPKKAVEQQLSLGKHVLLEIEVQGALQVMESRPGVASVFIMPPSWKTLKGRLEGRGTEEPQVVESRLEAARWEISQAPRYDYIVVNDDVQQCCDRLAAVISAAGCASVHMKEFVEEVCANA